MKNKKIELKCIHILIIIIGAIFIFLSSFHPYMWFDESYSAAIAAHSFKDIWVIGGHDVHPILYYWVLHIIYLIFGNNIIIYRLFSGILMTILGIVGFTHIRKDFGEKVGLLFSFFIFFLPVTVMYAGEMRMYSLVMLLVTLTATYAYRIYNNRDEINKKNWALFSIFSLATAYTHYYGLMTIGIINLLLMISLITKSIKDKKFSGNLKAFVLCGIIQAGLYLPWILYLALQMKQVSSGFWIGGEFPKIILDIFIFQFVGTLGDKYINDIIAIIFGVIILGYMIYLVIKNWKKDDKKIYLIPLGIYALVVIAACIMSLLMHRLIVYARYFLVITPFLIFAISYLFGRKGNRYINLGIWIFAVILACITNVNLIKINYDNSNKEPFDYISSEIKADDIILFNNELSGFVVTSKYQENNAYFWNEQKWNTDEAYKAFKNMKSIYELDEIKDFAGRIWIINPEDYSMTDKLKEKYPDIEVVKQDTFKTKYKNFQYNITLVKK